MQNKYVGDIGDFAKFSLLRALAPGYRLGVSWYLFPDEDEDNNDGRHIEYLSQPEKWRQFDEDTFDALGDLVKNHYRNVAEIERRCVLPIGTRFFRDRLDFSARYRSANMAEWRRKWFEHSLASLKGCDLVFADPDNGLKSFRPNQLKHAKSISEYEARMLADGGRPVVIYHHNSRKKGGHEKEVRDWQDRLGARTYAVRWRLISPRTFFILNCNEELASRAARWCDRWKTCMVALVTPPT